MILTRSTTLYVTSSGSFKTREVRVGSGDAPVNAILWFGATKMVSGVFQKINIVPSRHNSLMHITKATADVEFLVDTRSPLEIVQDSVRMLDTYFNTAQTAANALFSLGV